MPDASPHEQHKYRSDQARQRANATLLHYLTLAMQKGPGGDMRAEISQFVDDVVEAAVEQVLADAWAGPRVIAAGKPLKFSLEPDRVIAEAVAPAKKERRLSSTQVEMLRSLGKGKPFNDHVRGQAQHGGATGTLASLRRRGLVDGEDEITDAGRVVILKL